MSAYANWIEFRARDGSVILQRAEDISTILEAEVAAKGQAPKRETYLLLRNNNRVGIDGETAATILQKLRSCTGTVMSVIEREPDAE